MDNHTPLHKHIRGQINLPISKQFHFYIYSSTCICIFMFICICMTMHIYTYIHMHSCIDMNVVILTGGWGGGHTSADEYT